MLLAGIVVAVLAVIIAVVVLVVVTQITSDKNKTIQPSTSEVDEVQTFNTIPTPPGGIVAQAAVKALPIIGPFPTLQKQVHKGCPAGGDGTDLELNTLKNWVNVSKNPTNIQFSAFLDLPWPEGRHQQKAHGSLEC